MTLFIANTWPAGFGLTVASFQLRWRWTDAVPASTSFGWHELHRLHVEHSVGTLRH